MNEIRVDREHLLEIIRANRETHRSTFLKAQEGFRKLVIKKLDEMLENARNGVRFDTSVGLPTPQDMTKEYDMVISMLEMSVDEQIDISQGEFKMYVLDQWSWKGGWETSNSTYIE
jgi:hypothetical protein